MLPTSCLSWIKRLWPVAIPLCYIIAYFAALWFCSPAFPNGDDYTQIVSFLVQWEGNPSAREDLLLQDAAVHPHITTKLAALTSYYLFGVLSLRRKLSRDIRLSSGID